MNDAGVYRILVSVQFSQTTGNSVAELFLLVNGVPASNTNSVQSLKNGDNHILTVEFLTTLLAGQTVGVGVSQTGGGTTLITTVPSAPPIPASPAVVLTVQRVG